MYPKRSQVRGATSAAALLLVASLLLTVSRGVAASTGTNISSTHSGALQRQHSTRHYVGSQVCAVCHMQIYHDYEKTDMGRSMSVVTPQLIRAMHVPVSIRDSKSNLQFKVTEKDGRLYEAESAKSADGTLVFETTHEVRWIIGAGANGYGGIVKRGNYLFQAPLGFYTRDQRWAPSPGYRGANLAFSRPILEGCLFCHSGRTRPVAGTNGAYGEPAFQQLAIGCETCHGPGSAHVAIMTTGMGMRSRDLEILDPAKLGPRLANQICEECHEIGSVRILQPGKSYLDIRPGKPLNEYLAMLMILPKRNAPPPSDQLQQYYEMIMSKCYRATGGRLRCTTCHDPHIQVPATEATTFFNKRCLICHTVKSCTLSMAKRQKTKVSDNCIGCHMPSRPVGFIEHAALRNHRIIAYPGEPMPDAAYDETAERVPPLVDLDPPPGEKAAVQPVLTMLQAYGQLAAQNSAYGPLYLKALERASAERPGNALVQAALGRKDLEEGYFKKAVGHLRMSLKMDPMRAVTYADLSAALSHLKENDEALEVQEEAVKHDPYNPVLQKRLIVLFIHEKQYSSAKTALKKYVNTFPQDLFMRHMLSLAEGQQ